MDINEFRKKYNVQSASTMPQRKSVVVKRDDGTFDRRTTLDAIRIKHLGADRAASLSGHEETYFQNLQQQQQKIYAEPVEAQQKRVYSGVENIKSMGLSFKSKTEYGFAGIGKALEIAGEASNIKDKQIDEAVSRNASTKELLQLRLEKGAPPTELADEMIKYGGKIKEYFNQKAEKTAQGVIPFEDQSTIMKVGTIVAEGLGSMAPGLATGAAVGLSTKSPRAAYMASAAVMGGSEKGNAAEEYTQAIMQDRGYTSEDQIPDPEKLDINAGSTLYGGISGILNNIVPAGTVAKIMKGAGKRTLMRSIALIPVTMVETGTTEGITEYSERFTQNLIAKLLEIDPDIKLYEGALQEGIAGFIVGSLTFGMVEGVAGAFNSGKKDDLGQQETGVKSMQESVTKPQGTLMPKAQEIAPQEQIQSDFKGDLSDNATQLFESLSSGDRKTSKRLIERASTDDLAQLEQVLDNIARQGNVVQAQEDRDFVAQVRAERETAVQEAVQAVVQGEDIDEAIADLPQEDKKAVVDFVEEAGQDENIAPQIQEKAKVVAKKRDEQKVLRDKKTDLLGEKKAVMTKEQKKAIQDEIDAIDAMAKPEYVKKDEVKEDAPNIAEAENDWEENYVEKDAELYEKEADLKKEMKIANKARRLILEKQIKKINKERGDLEQEFIDKWGDTLNDDEEPSKNQLGENITSDNKAEKKTKKAKKETSFDVMMRERKKYDEEYEEDEITEAIKKEKTQEADIDADTMKKADKIADDEYGKPFEKLSKSQKLKVIEKSGLLFNIPVKDIVTPENEVNDVLTKRPDMFYGGIKNGTFTDSLSLFYDKTISATVFDDELSRLRKKRIKELQKRGETFKEAQRIAQIEEKSEIKKSQANFDQQYKPVIAKLKPKKENLTGLKYIGVAKDDDDVRAYFLRESDGHIVVVQPSYLAFIEKYGSIVDAQVDKDRVDQPIAFMDSGEVSALLMPIKYEQSEIPQVVKDAAKSLTKRDKDDTIKSDNKVTQSYGDQQGEISDTGAVQSKADRGSSEETAKDLSGYDRAAVLAQSGNGLGTTGANGDRALSKKDRQFLNEQAVAILENAQYSKNPDDYTETDKQILASYTGAGGKESVGAEGAGLLNEYYTPNNVIDKVWEIAMQLNPDAETSYEPSAGTGRFISRSPRQIKANGIEISEVSGTIANVLNADSEIEIGDFQEVFFDKKTNKQKEYKKYDIIIGNPPFGARAGFLRGKGEEKDISRMEEYFIKRGLDMLNDGGHLVYIVNSSFLQKTKSKGKEKISQLGKLVEAWRLPEKLFEDTTIGTDIVVFKKEPTKDKVQIASRNMTTSEDRYMRAASRDHVLGDMRTRKNRFGKQESYVEKTDQFDELLKDISVAKENKGSEITKSTEKKTTEKKESKKKETKKPIEKDSFAVQPKENAHKLVHATKVISASKASQTEINMYKRVNRDLSIPDPTDEEKQYLNYDGGYYYSDAVFYSGDIRKRIATVKRHKDAIIDAVGEEKYNEQLKKLEEIKPTDMTIDDIIFDPLDRHVNGMKTKDSYGNDLTVQQAFLRYVRRKGRDLVLNPKVQYSYILSYAGGSNMPQGTKDIVGEIKEDSKRIYNEFIKKHIDPDLQKEIVDNYNETKNTFVDTDYSKIPVEVQNMSKEWFGEDFELSETQKTGVSFLVNKGTGLIAYGVGVGKTHTLAVATKANMDKGWTKRPLFVVPKATIEKTWLKTLHELFPGVKINNLGGLQAPVIRKMIKERGEDRTQWIKDGEISVVSLDGLMRLGLKDSEVVEASKDLQDALFAEEASTKRRKEKEKSDEEMIIGQAQAFASDLMFSDLGFDHLSVDEVHNFRKVFRGAKRELDSDGKEQKKRFGNVIGGTPSKRAQQLFILSQFVQKRNNGRNVFLASATPFENHATEVYNILSFIARDRMKQMGIFNINDFFSIYSDFKTEIDRKLTGEPINREKMKNFQNLASLQKLLREFIDRKEDPTLVRPEKKVYTPHLQMSELQEKNLEKIQDMLLGIETGTDNEGISLREELEAGAFLKASTYSVANSVSPYFIDEFIQVPPTAEELVENSPKIKFALETIKKLQADERTNSYGTFLYFGKHGVRYHKMLSEYFADQLGLKREEVAFISGKVTDDQKEDIKERFNNGEIKVLIGGDQTKEGIDLQNNGFATINLALGWNPTEVQQVEGRVWRQGNRLNIAPVIYPLVENSGDVTMYAKFEEKGGRINDLLSYSGTVFDVSEVDPTEKKLALLTDPKDKAKMQIFIEKTNFEMDKLFAINKVKELEEVVKDKKDLEYSIKSYTEDIAKSWTSEETKKRYKAEIRKAKQKIERLDKYFEFYKIEKVDEELKTRQRAVELVEKRLEDVDNKYDELVAKYQREYDKMIAERKSMPEQVDEILQVVDELKVYTDEEIQQMRQEKIKELEASREKMYNLAEKQIGDVIDNSEKIQDLINRMRVSKSVKKRMVYNIVKQIAEEVSGKQMYAYGEYDPRYGTINYAENTPDTKIEELILHEFGHFAWSMLTPREKSSITTEVKQMSIEKKRTIFGTDYEGKSRYDEYLRLYGGNEDRMIEETAITLSAREAVKKGYYSKNNAIRALQKMFDFVARAYRVVMRKIRRESNKRGLALLKEIYNAKSLYLDGRDIAFKSAYKSRYDLALSNVGKSVNFDDIVPTEVLTILDNRFSGLVGEGFPESIYGKATLKDIVQLVGNIGIEDDVFRESNAQLYRLGYTRLGDSYITSDGLKTKDELTNKMLSIGEEMGDRYQKSGNLKLNERRIAYATAIKAVFGEENLPPSLGKIITENFAEVDRRTNIAASKLEAIGIKTFDTAFSEGQKVGYFKGERKSMIRAGREIQDLQAKITRGEYKNEAQKASYEQKIIEKAQEYDEMKAKMSEKISKQLARHKKAKAKLKQDLKNKLVAYKEVRKEMVDYIKENLPKKAHAGYLVAIRDGKTKKNLEKIMRRVDEDVLKLHRKQVIADIKKILERSNKLPIEAQYKMLDITSGINWQGMLPKTEEKLRKIKKYLKDNPDAERTMPKRILKKLGILDNISYKDLTTEQLMAISEQLHLIKNIGEAIKTQRKINAITNVNEKLEIIKKTSDNYDIIKHSGMKPSEKRQLKVIDKMMDKTQSAYWSIVLPVDTLIKKLDRGDDNGANYLTVKKPIDKAFNKYRSLMIDIKQRFETFLADHKDLTDENFERIGVYATRVQRGGVHKLLSSGYSQQEIDAVELTDKEMAIYSWMRNELDTLYPLIKKTYEDVFQKPFPSVENYFPFQTDYSNMAQIFEELHSNYSGISDGVKSKGFTKERKGGFNAIEINAKNAFLRHIDKATYFVALEKPLKDVRAIVERHRYALAVGEKAQMYLIRWLEYMQRHGAEDIGKDNKWMFKFINKYRNNLTAGILLYKLTTVFVQLGAVANGATEVGSRAFTGAKDVIMDKNLREFIRKSSMQMAFRIGDDPNFNDFEPPKSIFGVKLERKFTVAGKDIHITPEQYKKYGQWAIVKMDMIAAMGTWIGAYKQYLEGEGIAFNMENVNEEAVLYADKIVRKTQATSDFKDLPPALRTTLGKTLLQFQTFIVFQASYLFENVAPNIRKNPARASVQMSFIMLNLLWVSSVRDLIGRAIWGGGDDDDESFIEKMTWEFLQMFPVVGSVVYNIQNVVKYGEFGVKNMKLGIPATDVPLELFKSIAGTATAKKGETKHKRAAKAVESAATIAGVPGALQMGQAYQALLKRLK